LALINKMSCLGASVGFPGFRSQLLPCIDQLQLSSSLTPDG
jgi:hypothetical protein